MHQRSNLPYCTYISYHRIHLFKNNNNKTSKYHVIILENIKNIFKILKILDCTPSTSSLFLKRYISPFSKLVRISNFTKQTNIY